MAANFEHLERQLSAMGTSLDYPPTPDLSTAFWKRLEASTPVRSRVPHVAFAGAAMALVIVAAIGIVAIHPARDAAADLVHRINIFQTDESPDGLPTYITGSESTLQEAGTALGRHIAQPTEPSSLKLERVLLQHFGGEYIAVLFYRNDDIRFMLFASNLGVAKGIPIGGDATAEPVDDLGSEAFWLTGRRIVHSVEPDGSVIIGSERVTDTNALVWDQDGYVYRIEGDLTKDQAIAIAQSVR